MISTTPAQWRALPVVLSSARVLILLDAVLGCVAALLLAGPVVVSRLTGLPTMPGATARAPMVWEALSPLVIGTAVGLVLAGLQIWSGLRLHTGRTWARWAATAAAVVGLLLALPLPWGHFGLAFHFSAYSGLLSFLKPVLLLAFLLLLWLPRVSRDYFQPEADS